jgi:glutathione S-transferase
MRGPVLKLYGHVNPHSVNSLKVRVALAEADAIYEYIPVDLANGEQLRPEFLSLNPHGKIPVLVEDDFALPESDAILWYIAERYAEAHLIGTTPRERARTLQWCDFASTTLYPAYRDFYVHTQTNAPENRVPAIAEAAGKRFARALAVLEKQLADQAFLTGELTIADIANAAVLRSARTRMPYDAGAHPALEAWYERVTTRPSWKSVTE